MEDEPSPASGIEAFRDLERCLSGAVGGLAEIERESERRGREILRLALQAHIDARGDGDVGQAIVVVGEDGPVRLAHKRVHRRAVVTLFGEVSVTRVGYGAPGREAIHPLDAELMLPARVWSYECQRRLIRAVICGPFDDAIALIGEITGTTVPKRSAEQLVREAAVDFDSFYAARIGEAIEPPDGEILVGAIDCKGIPMVKPERALRVVRRGKGEKANKKRMATVAAVHSQPPIVRTPAQVIDSLFQTDPQVDRHRRRTRAATTRDQDFRERHARARPPARPGQALESRARSSPRRRYEAEAFVRHRAERILCGMAGQVVKGLRQTVTKRRLTGQKARRSAASPTTSTATATGCATTTTSQTADQSHPEHVEGACKNLIRDRSERSGMRWTIQTAEALLRLRAAHLSHDFNDYWEHHIRTDQQRLYRKDAWQPVLK